jgi:hypothetical protein
MNKQDIIKGILETSEFQDIINELRENQLNGIRYSTPSDKDARETFYMRLQVLDEIMNYLESIAKDSEIKDKAWKIL